MTTGTGIVIATLLYIAAQAGFAWWGRQPPQEDFAKYLARLENRLREVEALLKDNSGGRNDKERGHTKSNEA